MALTPKQARFVDEYLIDLNATQAAIRAGFSAKTAEQQAYQLLQKTSVSAAIAKAQEARARRTAITADWVVLELVKIGAANMADYTRLVGVERVVDLSNATRDQLAAVQEIVVEDFKDSRGEDARDVRRVRLKLADKRAALVDLGKHLGMFIERHEHAGKDGEKLIPDAPDPTKVALAIMAVFDTAKKG